MITFFPHLPVDNLTQLHIINDVFSQTIPKGELMPTDDGVPVPGISFRNRLLKVIGLRLLYTGQNPANPNPNVLGICSNQVIFPLITPPQVGITLDSIEVQFSRSAYFVKDATFFVNRLAYGNIPGAQVLGSIYRLTNDTFRWVIKPSDNFIEGPHEITLKGNGRDAIRDSKKRRLDGDPIRLPSGNDIEGGNFVARFQYSFG